MSGFCSYYVVMVGFNLTAFKDYSLLQYTVPSLRIFQHDEGHRKVCLFCFSEIPCPHFEFPYPCSKCLPITLELSKEMSSKPTSRSCTFMKSFLNLLALRFLLLNSCNIFCILPIVFSGWGNGTQEHCWEGRVVVKVRKQRL